MQAMSISRASNQRSRGYHALHANQVRGLGNVPMQETHLELLGNLRHATKTTIVVSVIMRPESTWIDFRPKALEVYEC